MSDHDYLWDRGGEPDPDVQRLERVLAPLAHKQPPVAHVAPRRRALRVPRWAAAVVGAAAAAGVVLFVLPARAPTREREPRPDAPALVVVGPARHLAEESWVESGKERTELTLGNVGRLTLEPQSRLQVRRLAADETLLYLAKGELHATVSADARPRFFQVDTPATRCVDLGCRYTLTVDDGGDAHVRVETGQVAFENAGREVYVPAGAVCRATRAGGAGTPRFEDAPGALATALDLYDAAGGLAAAERRARADAVIAAAGKGRDTLPLWHLLQDPQDEVASRARARLQDVAGALDPQAPAPAVRPDAAERARWKEKLAPGWW